MDMDSNILAQDRFKQGVLRTSNQVRFPVVTLFRITAQGSKEQVNMFLF